VTERDEKTLDYLKRLTRELQTARGRLKRFEAMTGPVAIVGVGCRFPGGATSREALWDIVAEGRDVIGEFPSDRGWPADLFDPDPDAVGKSTTRQGGFLYDAGEFDAAFFGMGPREARAVDPQQRVLLEVAWESIEDAGIDPTALSGTNTGVYVGVGGCVYGADNPSPELDGYRVSGMLASVVSGRVAYAFGLTGAAVSIDTACSSSLVAIHQACAALRSGESDLALAGGVTVLTTPSMFTEFSRQRGLSPDGRCKSFADAADGVSWGEGAGVLVLERLTDAQSNGRRILGVIRSSAVNQDGASNGLTAPNGPSQERVIRTALATAGLSAADVDVVEGHGTGTALGDPIEAQALLATYGRDRPRPLWLGSVKSNIGHTQAAAGMAGIVKMLEAMRHRVMPATLHVDAPSAHVDWASGDVRLLTEKREWAPVTGRPRRAAVSSFGISGTNAHVILEEAPQAESTAAEDDPPRAVAWVLSGRSAAAVTAQAERLRAWLSRHPEATAVDVGAGLARRAVFDHRSVVVGADRAELVAALEDVAITRARAGETVAVFPGQGAQWAGMGRELFATFPVFADAVQQICDPAWLFDPATDLDRTDNTQLGLFAIEVALFRLLEAWGVVPDSLVGHSVGEIAAAHVAGVLDLADAVRLVQARGRLMAALPAGGAMLAVDTDDVADLPAGVSVAARNAPGAWVLAGTEAGIAELETRWADRRSRRLRVSHAFHSDLMEPMLAEFADVCAGLTWRPARIPIASNVTGRLETDVFADPGYWVRHVRETVRFADATRALAGASCFVEVGPGSTASAMIAATLDGVSAVPLMRRGEPEVAALVAGLGRAFTAGVDVAWPRLFAGTGARPVDLPPYAFVRQRFWAPSARNDIGDAGLTALSHDVLTAAVDEPETGGVRLTGVLSRARQPWLQDHRILGRVLVPATAFVDLVLAAGAQCGCPNLRELTLQEPLAIPAAGAVTVQVSVRGDDGTGQRSFAVYAAPDGGPWTRHAEGVVTGVWPASGSVAFDTWPPEGATEVDTGAVYGDVAGAGYDYGPAFRGLRRAWRRGDELYVEVELGDSDRSAGGFVVHPALLDAVLHALALDPGRDPQTVALPFAWEDVAPHASVGAAARARISPAGPHAVAVELADDVGRPVLSVRAIAMRPVSTASFERVVHVVDWQAVSATATRTTRWTSWPATVDPVPPVVVADVRGRSLAGGTPVEVRAAAVDALQMVREWMEDERVAQSTLLVVTSGAVGPEVTDPAASAVWGLIRSAQAEDPGRLVLADITGAHGDPLPDDLVCQLVSAGEPQIMLRDNEILAARLIGWTPADDPATPDLTGGAVLIAGGTGMLGSALARHLVTSHGVRDLVLVSRRGGATADVDDLVQAGARVRVEACDVADRVAVDRLVAAIAAERPLVGIVHAAGVLDDGVIAALTPQRLDTVLAPKVDGAWNLHRATSGVDLAMFVLVSSAAGVLGAPGQANYAAANAYLDALAVQRRRAGLPAVAMAWGPWAGADGMAGALDEAARKRTARGGVQELPTDVALAAFDDALGSAPPAVVPVRLNVQAAEDLTLPPILTALGPRRIRSAAVAPRTVDLAVLTPERRRATIVEVVAEHAAAVLGHTSTAAIEFERPFQEMGFDSLAAVEFRNRVRAATGVNLPPTAVFDYPTPDAVSAFIAAGFGDTDQVRTTSSDDGAAGDRADRIRAMDEESLIRMVLGDEGGSA
jgi:acyl transferase domain-containing protein/acyl carrier protein